ncbi:MAG: polyprenyl synthetase family protein [Thermoplasmata archaeon]|nr:polyprenyl synthetase family protein [Thermoplasmata archaeon]
MREEGQMTFPEFFQWAQDEVRRAIENHISDEDMLYALQGGKKLRPAMLLLSFKACGGDDERYSKALESAMGIELAHSASLIHDDIMDKDVERRGRPALHVLKGLGPAILIGHRMINIAFQISLDHGLKNARIFLDTWDETLAGQMKDIDFTEHLEEILRGENPTKLINEYFRIIEMKTASLFATACRAGAIEAGVSDELIDHMRKYGREVGMAYQLADDFVDLVEGKKEEGIILPLIRAYGKVDEKIIEEVEKGNFIKDAFQKNGMDLKALYREEIRRHIEKAKELASMDIIPDNEYKKLLLEAPSYIVNAMTESIGVVI